MWLQPTSMPAILSSPRMDLRDCSASVISKFNLLSILGRRGKVEQRTAVEINESDILPAPCGKLTRLGGIPGSSLGRYAGRHGRQAGDSAKVGSGRLEAR